MSRLKVFGVFFFVLFLASATAKLHAEPALPSTSPIINQDESSQNGLLFSDDTEENIKELQRAIQTYNRKFPQHPITKLSRANLEYLKKYGFIKRLPDSIDNLVLRDRKVFRIEEKTPVGPGEEGLDAAFESALGNENSGSPKTLGDPGDNSKPVKHNSDLSTSHWYKEIKNKLRKIPKDPGKIIRPRSDRLSNELSPKQKKTTK